jgi:REP element-mobilizing transposase RayT
MPKPLRKILQGVTYHCYSRCQGLNRLLLDKYAKSCFLEAIKMCQNYYAFELIAAELVDNHIHLVIRTLENEETIDRIMQYIKARTAEKYNKATNRKGPFWNERYKCKIVEESEDPKQYLHNLLWYVGYNPVRKGLSHNPRENYIGFINCYLRENYEMPIKITLHHFFYKLGNTFAECVEKFLLYEEAYLQRLACLQ